MKARFKSMAFAALGTLSIFSAITYTSCERDKCKQIVCAYSGVCNDGQCLCVAGYEGPQCETINRQRFLNAWSVTENGSLTDGAQYSVVVVPGFNITEVRVRNFYNLFTSEVSGYVKGDTITIPQQVITEVINDVSVNYTVVGRGYVLAEKYNGVHGKLVLRYKVTDNNGQVNDFGYDTASDPSEWVK